MKTQILTKLHRQLIPNAGTLIAVAFLLFAYTAWAAPSTPQATPGVISWQGTLTDSSGQPITGDVDMTFRLYDAPTGGSALWEEAHTAANAVPVQDGLFHVYLGSLTPISSTVWANSPLYVGVQVGGDAEMSPREELGAVPYAMRAGTADKLAQPVSNIVLLDERVTLISENPATTNDGEWRNIDISAYVPDTAKGAIFHISTLAEGGAYMGGTVEISPDSPTRKSALTVVSSGDTWMVGQGIVSLVDGRAVYKAQPVKVKIFAISLLGYIE